MYFRNLSTSVRMKSEECQKWWKYEKEKRFEPDNVDGNGKEEEDDDEPGQGGGGDEGSALRLAVETVHKWDVRFQTGKLLFPTLNLNQYSTCGRCHDAHLHQLLSPWRKYFSERQNFYLWTLHKMCPVHTLTCLHCNWRHYDGNCMRNGHLQDEDNRSIVMQKIQSVV